MKQDIYKDQYQFEWDHRSHLTSAINIPIAVVTVIGGALAVMTQSFSYHQPDLVTYLFVVLITLSATTIAIAIYFLFKALHGHLYQKIPTPSILKNYFDELVQWHKTNNSDTLAAEIEFDEYFYQKISEAVEYNAASNKRKSGYLYRTNFTLAISLLLVGLSSVPFLVRTTTAEDKIYSIRVLDTQSSNKEIVNMPNKDQKPQVPPPQQTVPTPKPAPPANQLIKEYTVPPKSEQVILEKKG